MSLSLSPVLAAERLEFSLHRNGSGLRGSTLLVVGGIQGDEPGGVHATSLLVTDYRIQQGAVWVVPNLNFESIVKSSRSVHRDMNRKFARVKKSDPDFRAVERIKSLIRHHEVDFIVNLHDGSGFYRERTIDKMRNPRRWGQSIIIDQEIIPTQKYHRVGELSREVVNQVNKNLLNREHRYHVKNTLTYQGNEEMAKTLTYFAINNGKPAVGVEASKSLPTHERVYYHLNVLEAFLIKFGIQFERKFPLRPQAVRTAIDNNIQIALYKNKFLLDISKARKRIGYVPLKKNADIEFTASNPLVAITRRDGGYRVNFGNRNITDLQLQFFKYDSSPSSVGIDVDGQRTLAPIGSIVEVNEHFVVNPLAGYRVNIIGWTKEGVRDEVGYRVSRKHILRRFSVDRRGALFRVEIYRGRKFSGMVLMRFRESAGTHASLNPPPKG